EAEGIVSKLPDSFRPPLEAEVPEVLKVLSPMGIDDLKGCWSAIDPLPKAPHRVMAACSGGLWLGVVDSYSFADEEKELRAKLFGDAPISAAEQIALADRV